MAGGSRLGTTSMCRLFHEGLIEQPNVGGPKALGTSGAGELGLHTGNKLMKLLH